MTWSFECSDGQVLLEAPMEAFTEVNCFAFGEWAVEHTRAGVQAFILSCADDQGVVRLRKPDVGLT